MKPSKDNFFKTSDDAYIYFEDQGKGTPIILVPGFLCSTKFFQRNVPVLSQHHRVITMDPRGQGYSSKTLQGNTIKRHARDIHELIRHLELKDAILLGWSVGASVVTTYAADYKEEGLAGLALVDGSLFPFSDEPWNRHRGRDYNLDNWFATYLPLCWNPQEFYDKFLARISNHGEMPDEDREWIMEECKKTMPWTALELHYDFCHTNNLPNLEHLKVPVAIFGGDSEAYGLAMAEEYTHRIPGYSEVHRFTESGHLMFYYEYEKFNRCLMEFTDKALELRSERGK